jgi:hypothetical protein
MHFTRNYIQSLTSGSPKLPVNSVIPKTLARKHIEATDKEEKEDERKNALPEDVR